MGRGGFNPNQMLKQLQKVQQEMEQTQAELAEEVVEGSAGGGVVTVRVKGDSTVESITIDASVVDPEDTEMLGDLVTAAVNDLQSEKMGPVTGGMGGLGQPGT